MHRLLDRAVRITLRDESLVSISILALIVILISYSESFSYLCRSTWILCMMYFAKRAFPKANLHHRSTQIHLLDALVVPYNKKRYLCVQVLLLAALTLPVMLLMTLVSYLGHSSLYPELVPALCDTFIYALLFLLPLMVSHLSKDSTSSTLSLIIAFIFSLGYVLPQFFPLYSLLTLLLALCVPLLLVIDKLQLTPKKEPREKTPSIPEITKNQKGILTLSKMSIVKQGEVLETFGTGSFGYLFYYLYRTVRDVATGRLQLNQVFTWRTVLFILVMLSILSSIIAIRRIYIAKNMLRVVPIKKGILFSACSSLALRPIFIAEIAILAVSYLLHAESGFVLFFNTTHPIESIVHGLLIVSVPIAVYLISFTIYASKDRGLIGVLLVMLGLLGAYSFGFATVLTQDALSAKIIFLIVICTLPYCAAAISLKKLVNIHS